MAQDFYQRGLVLYRSKRYADACSEFTNFLKENPDSAIGYGMLALSAAANGDLENAVRHGEKSVAVGPNSEFAYYCAAFAHFQRDNYTKARKFIDEALRLSPEEADYYDVSARIYLVRQKYKEALAATEHGLESEPDHVSCLNVRAMALIRLGRGKEALASVDAALKKDPDDGHSHANKGWILIEQNRAKEAMEHFKEALRLQPGDSWAREGVLEALKHRHALYGVVAGLTFAVSNVSRHGAIYWAIWLIPPARAALLLLLLVAWWGNQLFNLIICLDSVTRKVLTADEIAKSAAFGVLTLMLTAVFLAGLFTPFFTPESFTLSMLVVILVTIPVCRTLDMGGLWRPFMVVYSAVALVVATYFIFAGHACAEKELPANLATPLGMVVFLTLICLFFPTSKK